VTRVIVGFFLVFMFAGCVSTQKNSVVYEEYKVQKKSKPLHVEPKTQKKSKQIVKKIEIKKHDIFLSGNIKGSITNLAKNKNLWVYEVKSNDTSNHKLAYAKFTHIKKLANLGDFVYATIKNNKLKEIFLIKKANYKKKTKKFHKKTKKIYKNRPKKTYKQTKKHTAIGVPTVEFIKLD